MAASEVKSLPAGLFEKIIILLPAHSSSALLEFPSMCWVLCFSEFSSHTYASRMGFFRINWDEELLAHELFLEV